MTRSFFMAGSPEGRPQLQTRAFSIHQDGMIVPGFLKRQGSEGVGKSIEKASLSSSGTIFVPALTERGRRGPDVLSPEWLRQEVLRVRQKPIPPGETPWYHLPGTGFWVVEQIDQLMQDGELSNVGVDTRAY